MHRNFAFGDGSPDRARLESCRAARLSHQICFCFLHEPPTLKPAHTPQTSSSQLPEPHTTPLIKMSSFLARRAAAAPSAFRAFSTSAPRGLARITLVGNLGDSPELVPTSTGHELIKYSIASSSGPKDNRHTSWFRVSKFLREGDEKKRDFLLSIPKGYVSSSLARFKLEFWSS